MHLFGPNLAPFRVLVFRNGRLLVCYAPDQRVNYQFLALAFGQPLCARREQKRCDWRTSLSALARSKFCCSVYPSFKIFLTSFTDHSSSTGNTLTMELSTG